MIDLNISTEHLSAHNALHDAVFTAHICQALDIAQGISYLYPIYCIFLLISINKYT